MTRNPTQGTLDVKPDAVAAQTGAPAAKLAKFAPPRPAVAPTQRSLFDRAVVEFLERYDAGEPLEPGEYCKNYPSIQSSLCNLLYLQLLLKEHPPCAASVPSSPAKDAAIAWPQRGEMFLDYTLLLELGSGALAKVFLANEAKMGDRLVVVKIAPLGGSTEAKILGQLHHPNIIPVYSTCTDPTTGLTAVCMPYVGSATLGHVLRKLSPQTSTRARSILEIVQKLPYPPDQSGHALVPARVLQHGTYLDGVRHLGAQLAEALAYIHERRIWHLDLKPANILLSPAGVPLLLDFNLATNPREANPFCGGTLAYMAPEQLRASARATPGPVDYSSLDGRADIFSLGVLLYELATGKSPFAGVQENMPPAELCQQFLELHGKGLIAVGVANPDVDKPLAQLIERCLAQNPQDRPQSAAEVATLLRKELAPHRRARRWIGSHPAATLTLTLILTFFFASLIGWGVWFYHIPYQERQFALGLEAYHQGQFQQAVEHFNSAIEADPQPGRAFFARGRAYVQLGKVDSRYNSLALADFHKADLYAPDGRTKACLGYCMNLLDQENLHQHDGGASAYYQKAIKAGYGTAAVFNNLGYCCLKKNASAEARNHLNQAIQLDDCLQAAYHNRLLVAILEVAENSSREDFQAKIPECLKTADSDMKRAFALGPVSAELVYDAACLHGLAAEGDPARKPLAVRQLLTAIEQGIDRNWHTEPLFDSLRNDPAFKKLGNLSGNRTAPSPAVNQKQRHLRIVDPIANLAR